MRTGLGSTLKINKNKNTETLGFPGGAVGQGGASLAWSVLSSGAPGLMDVCVGGGGGRYGRSVVNDKWLILSVLLTDPSKPPMLCDVAAGA